MAGKIVDVTLRLIDNVSSPLNSIGNNLRNTATQWTRAGRQIQNAGRDIEKVGKGLTTSITAPIVGLGTACVKVAADFEAGMDKVQSIAGEVSTGELAEVKDIASEMGLSFKEGADDTETAMNILSAKAKQMGAQTKFSATEASDAFSYMAMAGWEAADMMNGIEGIMYLAGATGEDLALTSDIVTDALTAFGMSADETNRFVDALAATANSSNTNVAMLGESFQYVAPVAGALGYSVEDVNVALGLMANSGIKASNAGTALRSLFTNLSKPTDQMANAMEELGISLTDSEGNMKPFMQLMQEMRDSFGQVKIPMEEFNAQVAEIEAAYASGEMTEKQYTDAIEDLTVKAYGAEGALKAKYAATLAGKTGMSGLLAIVNASEGDFNNLTEAIYGSEGACKQMYDVANDNLQGQLTILKSTIESIAISFGERLTPYVKQLATFVQGLADKFNSLSDAQMDTIIKIAAVAAAVGPAILVFGKMVTTVGKVVTKIGRIGQAFRAFHTVAGLVTSPVGLVIGGLLALVAAGVLVYKNWDKIKEAATRVFSYVKSVFESMGITGASMSEKFAPVVAAFNSVKDKAIELWTVISPVLAKIGEAVMTMAKVYIGAAIGVAIGWFQNFISTVSTVLGGIMTALGGIIDFITGVFTGNWSQAWNGIKSIFAGVFQSLVGLAKAPINGVISIINGAIAGINNLGVTIPEWVPGLGGKSFSINIPQIPTLAVGTDNWKGGIVQISEKGGEIVDLPSGSRVYPHDESVRKAYGDGASSGRGSVTIAKIADQIIVREEADIDKIAAKIAEKLDNISQNMGGGELGYIY